MGFANEILDAIDIMVKQAIEDNTTKIYTGVCKTVTTTSCTLTINGKDNAAKYYGGTPVVGNVYQVFIPFGNMSAAFIIVPGAGGDTPETGVTSVNGKTGNVVLDANDVGALPSSTTIPTKTSQLTNDSGFIDAGALSGYAKTSDIPIQTSQLENNSGFITSADVPTKVSELENDSGYITEVALDNYAKTADIPTEVSQLNNDSGFVNAQGAANASPVQSVDGAIGAVVTNAVKTIAQTLTEAQKIQARNNIEAGTSSFSGSYNDLGDKPDIPTKTSDITNDSGYITVNDVPVKSVNGKTGAVVLTQDDVGDGQTYVRTHNDFTDSAKQQINTNEDNIAMLDSDMEAAQADITTLKGNVTTLTNALGAKQDTITGAASTITDTNLTANRVLVSNGSGKVAVSDVTATELGYLDGVTSNVQTQLDKKLESAPVTSVNTKTGAVVLGASDVGAVSTSDVTTTLGTSTTKVPSEKAVSDALKIAGSGDMLKSTYDPDGSVATAGGIPNYVQSNAVAKTGDTMTGTLTVGSASLQTNGCVTGTWIRTTANTALSTTPTKIAVINDGWVYSRTPAQIKNDIGLADVVNTVNGQTGDVTIEADIPDNLVGYTAISSIESVDKLNADTLEGHAASYFGTASQVVTNTNNIATLTTGLSTANNNISALQSGKVAKAGDTMTGALVAQNNTNYTTAQMRNIIISTAEPSGGASGDIWIQYSE